jgi:hypothetical protein
MAFIVVNPYLKREGGKNYCSNFESKLRGREKRSFRDLRIVAKPGTLQQRNKFSQ